MTLLLRLFALTWALVIAQIELQSSMILGQQDEYFIGMDLSASYGAVAVAFLNYTTMPIARVEGSDEYKSLMAELGREDKPAPELPWKPANPHHAAILSKMIVELKLRAEDHLGIDINSTLVGTPALPHLYDATVHASIQDAGLEDMDHTWIGYIFKQPQGAMAGWDLGMCHEYWNQTACWKEIGEWPIENLITVLYTSNALCIGMGDSKGIYGYLPSHTYPSSMDFTLGYYQRHNNPDESFYWAAVRERFMRGMIGGVFLLPRNHTIFVHGDKDAVDDPKFREVLDRAVRDLLPDTPRVHYPDDPEFLVARGAATIVRRGGYGRRYDKYED